MYRDSYSGELIKTLKKLKKKDPMHYLQLRKKMDEILRNPLHEYKNLRYDMKEFKRIHIGHFVLAFRVDSANQIIYFEDYDHHDKMYRR